MALAHGKFLREADGANLVQRQRPVSAEVLESESHEHPCLGRDYTLAKTVLRAHALVFVLVFLPPLVGGEHGCFVDSEQLLDFNAEQGSFGTHFRREGL